MSDSVTPLSFLEGSHEREESEPRLRWMTVVKGVDAVPLQLPMVETAAAKASRIAKYGEQHSTADVEQGAAAAADGEANADAESEPVPEVPCPSCDERKAHLAEFEQAYLAAVRGMVEQAHRQSHALEGALIDLSLEIAKAIADGMAEIDPDLHLELARAALSELNSGIDVARDGHGEDSEGSPSKTVRLRVGVPGFEFLQSQLDDAGCLDGVAIELVRDPTIEGLGCSLESARGRVDGTVDGRMAQVQQALRTTWKAYGVEPAGASLQPVDLGDAADGEPPAPETEPEP